VTAAAAVVALAVLVAAPAAAAEAVAAHLLEGRALLGRQDGGDALFRLGEARVPRLAIGVLVTLGALGERLLEDDADLSDLRLVQAEPLRQVGELALDRERLELRALRGREDFCDPLVKAVTPCVSLSALAARRGALLFEDGADPGGLRLVELERLGELCEPALAVVASAEPAAVLARVGRVLQRLRFALGRELGAARARGEGENREDDDSGSLGHCFLNLRFRQ
jgi:hypothetical protein